MVNNRQMTKAKSIIELLIVAIIILWRPGTNFLYLIACTTLESDQRFTLKGSLYSYVAPHQSLNFVNHLKMWAWMALRT